MQIADVVGANRRNTNAPSHNILRLMEEFNIKQDLLSVTRLALYVCLYVCLFNSDASGFSQIIQASIINVSFEEPVSVVFPFRSSLYVAFLMRPF